MKQIISFIIFLGVGLFLSQAVLAALPINEMTPDVGEKAGFSTGGVDEYSLSRKIGNIIKYSLTAVGVVFLVMTVYAGFLWFTAGGNTETVDKAKKIITMGVIGVLVILSAYTIVNFVVSYWLVNPDAKTVEFNAGQLW